MCGEYCFLRAVKFKKISDIFLIEISSCLNFAVPFFYLPFVHVINIPLLLLGET